MPYCVMAKAVVEDAKVKVIGPLIARDDVAVFEPKMVEPLTVKFPVRICAPPTVSAPVIVKLPEVSAVKLVPPTVKFPPETSSPPVAVKTPVALILPVKEPLKVPLIVAPVIETLFSWSILWLGAQE